MPSDRCPSRYEDIRSSSVESGSKLAPSSSSSSSSSQNDEKGLLPFDLRSLDLRDLLHSSEEIDDDEDAGSSIADNKSEGSFCFGPFESSGRLPFSILCLSVCLFSIDVTGFCHTQFYYSPAIFSAFFYSLEQQCQQSGHSGQTIREIAAVIFVLDVRRYGRSQQRRHWRRHQSLEKQFQLLYFIFIYRQKEQSEGLVDGR